MLIGYLTFGRSFAYLGLPSFNVFIGDAFLVGSLVFLPTLIVYPWAKGLVSSTSSSWFAWACYLSVFYGAIELGRGLLTGFSPVAVAQGFVFNMYPLYFYVGLSARVHKKDAVRKLIIWLAWMNGTYGLLYTAKLSDMSLPVPNAPDVPLFGQPGGSILAILGLLAVIGNRKTAYLPLLLNILVLMAMQVRAEWLGLIAGLFVLSAGSRRLRRRVILASLLLCCALFTLSFFRVVIPGPRGPVATAEIVSRVVAPVNLEVAQRLSPNAEMQAGTVYWRIAWWKEIWRDIHASFGKALVGRGYGFPLFQLSPLGSPSQFLRTPHNSVLFALAYGGWIGTLIFLFLQVSLLMLVRAASSNRSRIFGSSLWAGWLVMSLFGNVLESPFGAIPFYLMLGMCSYAEGSSAILKDHGQEPQLRRADELKVAGSIRLLQDAEPSLS